MISTKQYINVDGVSKRFLVDFVISSTEHARVFMHTFGSPTISDIVPTNSWDLIDNSIVFYTAPTEGSSITIEVATTPEEFGTNIALPAKDLAEAAALLAEQYALQSKGYRDQSQLYSIDASGFSTSALSYATQALNTYNNTLNLLGIATGAATSANISALNAEDSYQNCLTVYANITDVATGAITIATNALEASDEALIKATNALSNANQAVTLAVNAGADAAIAYNEAELAMDGVNNLNEITTAHSTAITDVASRVTSAEGAISTLETSVSTLETDVITAQTRADDAYALAETAGGNKHFYQATAPTTGHKLNDVWYESDNKNIPYLFNGTSWISIRDTDIATALTTATDAYNLASAGKTDYNANLHALMFNTYPQAGVTYPFSRLRDEGIESYASSTDYAFINNSYGGVNGLVLGTNIAGAYNRLQYRNGYLFPLVNNVQTLGSSVYKWKELYCNFVRGGTSVYANIDLENADMVLPGNDNTFHLGYTTRRWKVIYAITGTINTSDERDKQDIRDLNTAEKNVALKLKQSIKAFRFRDAVAEKGDNARIHIGVIAQEVKSIFESEGLDGFRYGILCYDEWDEKEASYDTEGRLISPEIKAGNKYGIRYEELYAFIIAIL